MKSIKGKRVMFWTRTSRAKSEDWRLVCGRDESPVPVKAWKAFNKAFWAWKNQGRFYPLDALDAYQFAAAAMIRAAQRLSDPAPGDAAGFSPILRNASPTTYLVSTAFKNLLKYKERIVDSTRAVYRNLGERARVPVTPGSDFTPNADDLADREWTAATTSLDVRGFVEALPGTHAADRENVSLLAAACVYDTFTRLNDDARAGLNAWIAADGVWVDAAHLYNPHGSVAGYVYRFKCLWAPAFRKACLWRW